MNAYMIYFLLPGGRVDQRIMVGASWMKAWVSLVSALHIRSAFDTPIALLQVDELVATPSGTQKLYETPIRSLYLNDDGTPIQQQSELAAEPDTPAP